MTEGEGIATRTTAVILTMAALISLGVTMATERGVTGPSGAVTTTDQSFGITPGNNQAVIKGSTMDGSRGGEYGNCSCSRFHTGY